MKVLLTRPPGRPHYVVPPLGLLYVAAALRAAGHQVGLHDPTAVRGGSQAFLLRLRADAPDVVGISAHSCELAAARDVARMVARHLPDAVTVLGGAHVSAAPEAATLPGAPFHYGVVGEGEQPMIDLVSALAVGADPSGLPGVATRGLPLPEDAPRWTPVDLDALPLPAWDLAPPASYRGAPQGLIFRRWPIAPLLTSRGCPHVCSFCAGSRVMGRTLRTRGVASIVDEVHLLTRTYGVRELHVVDDTFASDPAHAIAVCEALAPFGLTLSFPNGLRLDSLSDEVLVALRRAGTYSVNLGLESGSQRVLNRHRKGLALDGVRDAIRRVRAAGIETGGFFILGLPGETLAEARETIRFASGLPLDRAHFSNFLPLPGTDATRGLVARGVPIPAPEDLTYYDVPFAPDGLTPRDLKRLQRRAYLRFYLTPRRLAGVLAQVRSPRHARYLLSRVAAYLGRGRHG